ncbi:F-box domain-containing protein [Artemisia annua]|uniref:F-box domain-containing protein n=1 Tax=Artemisia annua TaxID=35608 RepID=A0A2U1NXB5_ARTAN|nr:F-box domain-containing protein [Artemisia annua]
MDSSASNASVGESQLACSFQCLYPCGSPVAVFKNVFFLSYITLAEVLKNVFTNLWKEETVTEYHTPEIPFNIIQFEILPKLPVKSLGCCMCVCKEWKSYLSTREFVKMHLHQQVNRCHKLLIFDHPYREKLLTIRMVDCDAPNVGLTSVRSVSYSSLPYRNVLNNVYVLSSFDGLVCLASPLTEELAFWNPLTHAYKKLQANSSSPRFYDCSSDVIAFYMDSFNDDYKLLHIMVSNGFLGAYVYSLRVDSWKKIDYLLENIDHSDYFWTPTTVLGQLIYFVVWGRSANARFVSCFDDKSEKFREIQFPSLPVSSCIWASLMVLYGGICLCVVYGDSLSSMEAGTWRMDGDDGWVKVKAFSLVEYDFSLMGMELELGSKGVGNVFLPLLQKCSANKRKIEDDSVDVDNEVLIWSCLVDYS